MIQVEGEVGAVESIDYLRVPLVGVRVLHVWAGIASLRASGQVPFD